MLRITDIRTSASALGEYVVLQNVGVVPLELRGWTLAADAYFAEDPVRRAEQMFVFSSDVRVGPGIRVVLFTGEGEEGWRPTTDGKRAYVVYWNRPHPVWSHARDLYLLQPVASRPVYPTLPREVIRAEHADF